MRNVALIWQQSLFALDGNRCVPIPPSATTAASDFSRDVAERLIAYFPRGPITLLLDAEQLVARTQTNVIPRLARAGTRSLLRAAHPEVDSNTTGWGAEKAVDNTGRASITIWVETSRILAQVDAHMRNLGRELGAAYPLVSAAAAMLRKRASGRSSAMLLVGEPGVLLVALTSSGQVVIHRHAHHVGSTTADLWQEVGATLELVSPSRQPQNLNLFVLAEDPSYHPAAVWPGFASLCELPASRVGGLGELARTQLRAAPQLNLIGDFDRPKTLRPVLQAVGIAAFAIAAWGFYGAAIEHSRLTAAGEEMTSELARLEQKALKRSEMLQELDNLTKAYGPGVNFTDDGRAWRALDALSSTSRARILPAGAVVTSIQVTPHRLALNVSMPHTPLKEQGTKANDLATGLMRALPDLTIESPGGVKADAKGVVLDGRFN